MMRWTHSAPVVFACLLAAGCFGVAATTPALAKQSARKSSESRSFVLEAPRRRYRPPRIRLPVGPSYTYVDYPYYYSRGYYPKHIGGYVYEYPVPSARRCPKWQRRCAAKR